VKLHSSERQVLFFYFVKRERMAQAMIPEGSSVREETFKDYVKLSDYTYVKVMTPGRVDFVTVPMQYPTVPSTTKSVSGLVLQRIAQNREKINDLIRFKEEDMFQLQEKKWVQVKPFGEEPHKYWYVGFLTLNAKGIPNGRYSLNLSVAEWQNLDWEMDTLLQGIDSLMAVAQNKQLGAKQVKGYKWQWKTEQDKVFLQSDVWYFVREHAKVAGMMAVEEDRGPLPDSMEIVLIEELITVPHKIDWIELMYIFALKAAVGNLKHEKCSGCALGEDLGELSHKKEGGCKDEWIEHVVVHFDEAKMLVNETLLSDLFQYSWTKMGKKPENILDLVTILRRVKKKSDLVLEVEGLRIDLKNPMIAMLIDAYKCVQHVVDISF
jgi:hypothetical protein